MLKLSENTVRPEVPNPFYLVTKQSLTLNLKWRNVQLWLLLALVWTWLVSSYKKEWHAFVRLYDLNIFFRIPGDVKIFSISLEKSKNDRKVNKMINFCQREIPLIILVPPIDSSRDPPQVGGRFTPVRPAVSYFLPRCSVWLSHT